MDKTLLNANWWKAVAVRAIKTGAETAIGVIGASTLISEVDWKVVLSAVGISMLMTLLLNLRELPEQAEEKK